MFTVYSFLMMVILFLLMILVISIPYISIIRKLKNAMSEQSRMIYSLMIRQNFSNDKVDDVSAMMDSVSKTISTLSTSISSVLKENNRLHNEKIMPSPNLAEMITATIKEQLSIEFNLSKGQRLPNKDSISKIIMNVQMTYPHVNEEYIVKKCLAMIESMSLQE